MCFSHIIISKGLLNLLDNLGLRIAKLLTEFDAVSLLDAAGHLDSKGKSVQYTFHVCTQKVNASELYSLQARMFFANAQEDRGYRIPM